MTPLKKIFEEFFQAADIQIDGQRPWDIRVSNPKFYRRFLTCGTLGLGEAYMENWWDCESLDQMMYRVAKSRIFTKLRKHPRFVVSKLWAGVFNLGSRRNAKIGVRTHYDIGNDLFRIMLDPRMTYTCGYWNGVDHLDEAQTNKLELICRKLELKPGLKVLDIGCGWGSFAKYAAERYGVEVLGITISDEQINLARELCRGLPVQIENRDYRDVTGRFDRILSVGMFEHVCLQNHRTYMETVHRHLTEDGISLLHTIGRDNSLKTGNDKFIKKYVFPNTLVPSVAQIGNAIDSLLVMEDWENLSTDYAKTLRAWFYNFERGWGEIESAYGAQFYRMWKYYLLMHAGFYQARRLQLWQIVLTKNGLPGGYAWQKQRRMSHVG